MSSFTDPWTNPSQHLIHVQLHRPSGWDEFLCPPGQMVSFGRLKLVRLGLRGVASGAASAQSTSWPWLLRVMCLVFQCACLGLQAVVTYRALEPEVFFEFLGRCGALEDGLAVFHRTVGRFQASRG